MEIITPIAYVYVESKSKFMSIYRCPIYYCKNNGKIILYWGLGLFYFKQMFSKRPDRNLGRFCWFFHLKLNILHFMFFPYILYNNKKFNGETGIIKSNYNLL